MLANLARNQCLTVATLQERDGFQRVAFLCDVGKQRKVAFVIFAQIFGELLEASFVIVEHPIQRQYALLPGIGRQAMGVEVKEAVAAHVLILLMTS